MDLDLPASPRTPPPDPDRTVAVVGGGAVGATAARDLARWGADVTLFERDAVGGGATGRAAGIVYDAFAEDLDAAVADRALDRFRDVAGAGEFAPTERPYVWFAREGDDRRATAIGEQVPRMRANGRDVDLLAPETVRERWPCLRADDLAVVAVARNAFTAAPKAYAAAMAERAAAEGATIETGRPVRIETDPVGVRIERSGAGGGSAGDGAGGGDAENGRGAPATDRRRFDAVLVAAGAHAPTLLADAGIDLACEPYRVQALTVGVSEAAGSDAAELPSFYDATGGYYARPKGTGLLAGDGTEPVPADPDDWERGADEWFREDVLADLTDRVGGVAAAARDLWAGLCTATPDRNPLVGRVAPGLFVATGFHGHGFMRAPAIGELVARQVCGGAGVPTFDPTRFDGSETFEIVEGMTVDED